MQRRHFLQSAVAVSAASARQVQTSAIPGEEHLGPVGYPRSFTSAHLSQIAFPLGGIGTGSISLGGRGQFRDWEIFNRPDKGLAPDYGFASIWVQSGKNKPYAAVLESRLLPAFSSEAGLGPGGVPGLKRLESATFTGEYPKARIDFHDDELPLAVQLEAFSPLIPLDVQSSSYPAFVLRYRVHNRRPTQASVSVAFSLENPVGLSKLDPTHDDEDDTRNTEFRQDENLQGLFMTNPGFKKDDNRNGSFALTTLKEANSRFTYLRGWPDAKWWASPMLFWDDFSSDGALGPETERRKPFGSICVNKTIPAGGSETFTFFLGWHFPNRTPGWCGWDAPKGHETAWIGNAYCVRFPEAWAAVAELSSRLPDLERRTDRFLLAMRKSTLPAAVRDGAMANLSTLVSQTCFQTADGEFHGFEGCNDHHGCCFGNCTHVWNYESVTQHLFPALAHSLRKAAFGYSEDEQGGMRHRQFLPDGIERYGYAAADGQMGQIIKLYLDYKLSGDVEWLRPFWPRVKLALSFPFVHGGWDPERSGVLTGVQHNTYDVEFYGPNPLCGIYYLGALRAGEEIARVLGHGSEASEYHRLFAKGSAWIDGNLFNGEYYVQQVHSIPRQQVAPATVSQMGSDSGDHPEFQLGDGCLGDQLIGQYLADLAGLGPLLKPENLRKTLAAIQKYNYRANLMEHNSVQRVYVLNDEPTVLICDYGRAERPKIPFPYYAEAWTGIEYLIGAQMITYGMHEEGLQVIDNIRRRFDGLRRNPWDEPECGHHYARAMSSWSGVLALTGFQYDGERQHVIAKPRGPAGASFRSLWSTGTGWGTFAYEKGLFHLQVEEGILPLRSLALHNASSKATVVLKGRSLDAQLADGTVILNTVVSLQSSDELTVHL